jgi:DNA replication and repair protein RecF
MRLNGAALTRSDELRASLSALAFTPDRLAIVKGGPIVRRAYLDRMLGRVFPARAPLPSEYALTLAQRNAALRRVRAGESNAEALAPWSAQLAELGSALDDARAKLVALLAPGFEEVAEELGLEAALIDYEARGLSVEELEERLEQDIARGVTGVGPHRQDARIEAGGRDLRSLGSQGEQRSAVLAIVLAEAAVIAERRGTPPLLLLDDVFSELDEGRRRALVGGLPAGAQTVISATERTMLPGDAELVVAVTPGRARAA